MLCCYADKMLRRVSQTHHVIIVSGTARGADQLGERYAERRGYTVERCPADWENYGRSAGMARNKNMAARSDALIAFWDGKSPGTKNMINLARERGLKVRVKRFDE